MSLIRKMVRTTASNITRVLKERAQLSYEDGCLQIETHLRGVKQVVENTAPYIVVTGLGKVTGSLKRTHFPPDRGRVDKKKRRSSSHLGTAQNDTPYSSWCLVLTDKMEQDSRMIYEQRRQEKLLVDRREALCRAEEARDQALEQAERRKIARLPPPPPQPAPGPWYDPTNSSNAKSLSFEENMAVVQEKLADFKGPDRIDQLRPSGHSGIDPVIDQYNLHNATNIMLDQWKEHQAEQRRLAEEQQRQEAEEATARQVTAIILDHHRVRYCERVNELITFGPLLTNSINMFESAVADCRWDDLALIVSEMTDRILHPVNDLFKDMKKDIPLEEEAANRLRSEWPMDRLDELYRYLLNTPGLPDEFIYLGKGVEVIRQYIYDPTPFQNPLAPKPQPVNDFRYRFSNAAAATVNPFMVPPSSSEFAPGPIGGGVNTSRPASTGGFSVLGVAASAPANPSKSTDGLNKLIAATKAREAKRAAAGMSILGAASGTPSALPTSTNDKGEYTALLTKGSSFDPVAVAVKLNAANGKSGVIIPPPNADGGVDVGKVLAHCSIGPDILENSIDKLVTGSGALRDGRAQEIKDNLQELLDMTFSKTGVLASDQATQYRAKLNLVLTKLSGLNAKFKNAQTACDLRKQVAQLLKLWVV